MTVFVAGATGYTGRAIVEVAREQGLEVVAHVRPDSPRRQEWTERFQELGAHVSVAAWELDAMTAELERLAPTAVFASLGTTRKRAAAEGMSAGQAYEAIDEGLTVLLLQATRAAAPGARFVYVSALGARAGTPSAYMAARWRTEQAIRDSGQPFTIARPSIISGPGRDEERPMERVAERMASGALAVVGALGGKSLVRRFAPTTNRELATALVRSAADPQAEGRVLQPPQLRV